MNTVYILQGLQASGKSTWAKEWVNQDPTRRVIISKDDIRYGLGHKFEEKLEPLVKTIFDCAVKASMLNEVDIAIDNTNLYPQHVNHIVDLIKDNNSIPTQPRYRWDFVRFYSEPTTCLTRDSRRSDRVGEDVIRKFYTDNEQLIKTVDAYHNPISLIPAVVKVYNGMELKWEGYCSSHYDFLELIKKYDNPRLKITDCSGTLFYLNTETGCVGAEARFIDEHLLTK